MDLYNGSRPQTGKTTAIKLTAVLWIYDWRLSASGG